MCKLCIFAGTTEGRELAEFLDGQNVSALVCVATEYGQTLVNETPNVTVRAGRLEKAEMEALFRREAFDLVVDATHPYAALVTENLRQAAESAGVEYLRLLRRDDAVPESAVCVSDVREAAEYLASTSGNVLLTTGSKELNAFSNIPGFADRVYARVLPMESSLALCREVGLSPSHILAMQGPFSLELNEAMLKSTGARFLVTKASGAAGGFGEKLEAAKALGVTPVIIGRPPQAEGLELEDTISLLCDRFGLECPQEIAVVGIGPGSGELLTAQAQAAICRAQCLIGAERMLQAVRRPGQAAETAITAQAIRDCIRAHKEFRRFAVVLSGDVGFFSGAKKLLPLLAGCKVTVVPGISSMVYLCAKLGASYEDVLPVTLHGRENPILLPLSQGRKVFVLVGGENGMGKLCRRLTQAGLGDTLVSAGQNLSYPEEEILTGTAGTLQDHAFAPLCAALLTPQASRHYTPGLPDEAFSRAPSVPMTKSEVRAICLSRLALPPDAVVWDVGAGTGSVTVELALSAPQGHVYAIERKPEALDILKENLEKFCTDNVTVVPGAAPDCCAELPAPTHVFLGGTGGETGAIVDLLLEKNPKVRIVATAVTLESLSALTALLPRFPKTDVTTLSVTHARPLGAYHLLTAQNPITIFTLNSQ